MLHSFKTEPQTLVLVILSSVCVANHVRYWVKPHLTVSSLYLFPQAP